MVAPLKIKLTNNFTERNYPKWDVYRIRFAL